MSHYNKNKYKNTSIIKETQILRILKKCCRKLNKETLDVTHNITHALDAVFNKSIINNVTTLSYEQLLQLEKLDSEQDIIYIKTNKHNMKLANIVNKYGPYTSLFILYVPNQYQFNTFIKAINYNNVDIYHNSNKQYYIVISTIK
uniref:Uncharacterized protein n=1 Tax=Mimivirus LCMiAC02 TaxID=2506609 RepID=A0A4P6VLS8_9VIRU|nr:MAG: hypothetical protein LCMiAC02_04870 [Mimivirus LCMiAC02]